MNSNKENQLIIFTIFLSGENDDDFSYGKSHLDEIAEIGGSKNAYKETTFRGLDNAFQDIANLINPKFGLKIK